MKRPEPTELEEKDAAVPEGTDEETPEAGPRSTVDVFLNEDAEAMGEDGEEDELDISDYPSSPLEEEMLAVLDKMLDEEEAEFLTQYARFAKHLSAQEVAAGPVDEAPVPEGTGKADPTWDELEHPREADGTFAEKEGGKSGYVSAKSKGPGDFPEDSEQQLISLREKFKMGDKKTDLSLAAEQERLAILELSLSKAAGWDESEHPREEDGKFAEKESSGASGSSGYVPGKEMTYEDFPENARELFLAEHKRLREKGDRGDAYLSALNKIQGYDGLPTLVTEEEMDRMVESGEVTDRIYRGCPPAYGEPHNKYTKQFLEGEFYAGQGLYGNGTYTSLDQATARSYGNGMEEAQLNLGIRKGAKIVSFEDLENEYQAEYDRWKKLPRQDRSIIQDVIMEGISNFAVMRGYDGFRIRKNGHVVILNRTAVYAEDKPRKLYSEQPQPTYDLSTPAKSSWEESEHPREADGTFTQKESLASSIKSGSRKIVTDDSWYDADSWRQNLKTVIGEDTLIGFDGDRERVALVNPATGEVLAAGILVKSGGQDGYPVKHSVTGLKSSATRKGYATRLYERLLSYVPSLRPEFKQTPDGKAFWDSLKKNPKFVWDEAQGLKLVSPAKALQTWDESEHPRDADGKFINKARMAEMVAASDATYIRINEGDFDFENIDSDITQILTDFLDSEEYKEGSYTGDAVLSLILKNNTMDSLPVVVSSEDMDQLEASGQLAARCYRGVVSPTPGEYAEQYRTGDMYVGYGIRGNGVYTSSNFDIASVYSGGDDRDILDIGIRKDARIIQFHKLESLMNSTMDKLFESMGIDPNSSSAQLKNARPEQRAILEDPGRLAAFLGYDAIESTLGHDGLGIPPVPMFIILNRSATFVVGAPEQASE